MSYFSAIWILFLQRTFRQLLRSQLRSSNTHEIWRMIFPSLLLTASKQHIFCPKHHFRIFSEYTMFNFGVYYDLLCEISRVCFPTPSLPPHEFARGPRSNKLLDWHRSQPNGVLDGELGEVMLVCLNDRGGKSRESHELVTYYIFLVFFSGGIKTWC